MREAYATVSLAIRHLVSGEGDKDECLKNQDILRSVLRRRPVSRGFALSALVRRLQEGASAGKLPGPQGGEKHAGKSTWAPTGAPAPPVGIGLALEVVLESSYHPSTPQSIAPVLNALGEDGLEALLQAPEGTAPSLPWTARLCLLHASLAGGNTAGRRWRSLSTVADSACSAALQDVATTGGSSSASGSAPVNGKAPARLPPGTGASTRVADTNGPFDPAFMAQVCEELAKVGAARAGPSSPGSGFLHDFSGLAPRAAQGGSSPTRRADPFPGGRAAGSFRQKLGALRDALLSTSGSEGRVEEEPGVTRVMMVGEVALEDLEVHPEAVRRALERGRCGDAFIVAVKAALEANLAATAGSEAMGQAARSGGDRQVAIRLKKALEACLFGVGVSGGRGLLDAVAADDGDVEPVARSSPAAAAAASAGVTRPSWAASTPPTSRRAFAFMRGLVEEGVRIRDLVLALVGIHRERELQRPLLGPGGSMQSEASAWRTGAQAVAAIQSACDFRRGMVVAVLGTFVEWLADTPWVWGATEGMNSEDWEGDFAAAALAIPVAFPAPLADAEAGLCAAPLVEQLPASARGPSRSRRGSSAAGDSTINPLSATGRVDPADVLDRLVGGVAAAMEHAGADRVGWVDVFRHLTAAAKATATSVSLKAYALACVEKSVSLGGQAPFRVSGKRRFSQVGGKELWGLLEEACQLNGDALVVERTSSSVVVRTAAAAVSASRRISQSCMISPGLLGSGPMRVLIDMVGAAKGCVTTSMVLSGLLETQGEEGPALAADMFAAFIAAATATSERTEGSDGESALRSRAIAWLSSALSASSQPVQSPPTEFRGVIASAALTRVLIGRVPYEAKPVLLAVQEAAELGAACTRRSGKRKHKLRAGVRDSLEGAAVSAASAASSPLATLLRVTRAAWQSHLLPLPAPASLSPPRRGRSGSAEGSAGAGYLLEDGSPGCSMGKRAGGEQADAPAASVTAGLLLDSFVQSPTDVRRSIREAMQQRGCNNELRVVLRTLRLGLCTASIPPGGTAGSRTADTDASSSEKATLSSAGVGARKAPACLLVGYLVESGVPGWEETKAAMVPPPPQLLEAAEGQSTEEGAEGPLLRGGFRQPLTALRLEMWLRPLLRDGAGPGFDTGEDIEKSFPDVFRTARTLARAIARYASHLVTRGSQGVRSTVTNSYFSQSAAGFGNVELPGPTSFVAHDGGPSGGTRTQEIEADGRLDTPRRALAARLRKSPAAQALVSWVPSIVKTAKQFRPWLPWQPFAEELRELLSVREHLVAEQAGGGSGAVAEGNTSAAEAAVFAVCELLLAWEGTGQEVVAHVFRPALCSKALEAAAGPVPADSRPPIWLEVLRCLVGEGEGSLSDWMASRVEDTAYQCPLSVAAAAALWIGGDGAGGGQSGKRSTREAWMRWYEAKLGPLIPPAGADFGNWLILSNVAGRSGCRGVQVRAGVGGAAPPTIVQPREWEKWGRSPLEAAWKIPAGWAADEDGPPGTEAGVAAPHAIVLPSFASWLRVVLRGGPGCPEGVLEAYLRRMAREVFLPCQFGGASSEMARQWLGVLIEAEAAAERKRRKVAMASEAAAQSGWRPVKACCPSGGNEAGATSARQVVVKAFFREELLRFGSGEAAAAAAVGGPLTWLWPLEAVVSACGKAGSFGGGVLARRRRGGPGGEPTPRDSAPAPIVLDGPPSALARVLSTVPHDLLCGSRRFDRGGGQPPPAPATLRAFAGRVVDLTARALASPPCRHWSVARRLLLGLGLLYHALATPPPGLGPKDGESQRSPGATAQGRAVEARARGEDAAAQAAAQAAVLSAIETLVSIALGFGNRGARRGGGGGGSARVDSGHRGPTALLSLQPLEVGTCVGADNLAEALRGAGAWRAAAAFFGRRKEDLQGAPATQDPSVTQTAPAAQSSRPPPPPPPTPPPPLSPQADLPWQSHLHPSPGAIPAMDVDQPVGGDQANGQSTAGSPAEGAVDGEPPGGDELRVSAPHVPSWGVPSVPKKARLSTSSTEGAPPPCSARRVLPARSSKRLHSGS